MAILCGAAKYSLRGTPPFQFSLSGVTLVYLSQWGRYTPPISTLLYSVLDTTEYIFLLEMKQD